MTRISISSSKKVFIVLTLSTVMLTTCVHGKCPTDPLDCVRPFSSADDVSSQRILQEIKSSLDSMDDGQVEHRHQHHHQLHHHFSLNDSTPTKKCSKCPKNGLKIRSCNETHDTQCVCPKGSFLDIFTYDCRKCSDCPTGYGVWRSCGRYRDTKCRQCPPGSYSGVMSNQMGCVLCSTCRSDQIMLQECTKIQNTVCVDKSIGKNFFLRASTHDPSSDSEDVLIRGYPSIHVPFVILVVIIIIASFSVIMRLLTSPTRHVKTLGHHHFRPAVSNLYSPLPVKVASSRLAQRLDTTSFHQRPSYPAATTRFCDLSKTKRRAVEASLNNLRNDLKDWRGLGRILGFGQEEMAAFEASGQQDFGPSRFLLNSWAKRDGKRATVQSLVVSLVTLGRIDSAHILDPSCVTSSSLPVGFMV